MGSSKFDENSKFEKNKFEMTEDQLNMISIDDFGLDDAEGI